MAASFAAYASQILAGKPAESSLGQSQPLFYSFSTNGDHDGSRGPHAHRDDALDDEDDPHLRGSAATSRGAPQYDDYPDMDIDADGEEDEDPYLRADEVDDPYLRLDEDERAPVPGTSAAARYSAAAAPLLGDSRDSARSKGWLAHAGAARSPSPAPSSASSDDGPPASLFAPPPRAQPRAAAVQAPRVPPPPQTALALSLTEALLPRDGRARPHHVFSLPDPRHASRGRRRYNDSPWIAAWLTGLGLCVVFSVVTLFAVHKPDNPRHGKLPYVTLLHTVPLLTILTCASAVAAYAHLALLRLFAKPVMIATTMFVPVTLLVSALWAFIGSFMWDGAQEPTWGETVG
jgi:hypothetical protein